MAETFLQQDVFRMVRLERPQSVELNDVNAGAVAPSAFCLTGFAQARKTVREERVRTCNKEPKWPAEITPNSKKR